MAGLLLLLFVSTTSFGQTRHQVLGTVVDTASQPLAVTTAVLLQAKDSVLYQFTITNDDGGFLFKNVQPGDYILQLSYLGHYEHTTNVNVPADQPVVSVGNIVMLPKNLELTMFTVTGRRIPIIFKQDTIEYNADAYRTEPGSTVEDLLSKMPGIEVEKDGTVKAQGEEVGKVLVDGKEFFGDDTQIATQNLPADAVDKVQVFDKKSETAEFSGVDDGETTKTINLELKEDKKNGYFGDATAGYGTDNRYIGKGNVNRFSPKTRFSAIGVLNNINEPGFSFEDYINFMGGLQALMSGGSGGMMDFNDLGVPLSLGLNDGFMTTSAIGTNLNLMPSEKTTFDASYFFSNIDKDVAQATDRQYFALNDNLSTQESSVMNDAFKNHRLNYKFKHELDDKQDLTIKGNFGFNNGSSVANAQLMNFNSEGATQSSSSTFNSANAQDWRLTSDLIYRKKFKKKGRFLVADFNFGMSNDERAAALDASNTFFDIDTLGEITSRLLQDQNQVNDAYNYGGGLSWTEPVGKRKYLQFNYDHQLSYTAVKKDFFDVSIADLETTTFNEDLSDEYTTAFTYDRGGVSFKANKKDRQLTISTDVQYSQLDGQMIAQDTSVRRTFFDVLPALRLNRNFTGSKRFQFSYATMVNAPAVQQLSPLVNNSDPLNLYVGNPELDREYIHMFNTQFVSFSQFSLTEFFASARAQYTQDKINNSVSIDSALRQVIIPVNVTDDFVVDANTGFGAPIKVLKTKFNIDTRGTYNRGRLLLNAEEYLYDRTDMEVTLSFENRNQDKVSIEVGSRYGQSQTTYRTNSDLNQSYENWLHFAEFGATIKKHWRFATSMDYSIYSGDAFSGTQEVPIWRASLQRYLLDNKIRVKVSVVDILNRNNGISRNNRLNYIEEQRIQTLGRFAMFSISYRLSGFGNDAAEINVESR